MLDNRSMATVRLALCQLNPTVGDIAANESAIAASIDAARERGAQLVVFGELAVTGYPPEDLLYRGHFLRDARAAVERLARESVGIVAVVGFPERGAAVHNSAAVLADGRTHRGLSQDPPAELRGLRRAALLQGRRRGAA